MEIKLKAQEMTQEKIINRIGRWKNEQGFVATLLNADETSWYPIDNVEFLHREEALQHHYKSDIFRIVDEIWESDWDIISFFENNRN